MDPNEKVVCSLPIKIHSKFLHYLDDDIACIFDNFHDKYSEMSDMDNWDLFLFLTSWQRLIPVFTVHKK